MRVGAHAHDVRGVTPASLRASWRGRRAVPPPTPHLGRCPCRDASHGSDSEAAPPLLRREPCLCCRAQGCRGLAHAGRWQRVGGEARSTWQASQAAHATARLFVENGGGNCRKVIACHCKALCGKWRKVIAGAAPAVPNQAAARRRVGPQDVAPQHAGHKGCQHGPHARCRRGRRGGGAAAAELHSKVPSETMHWQGKPDRQPASTPQPRRRRPHPLPGRGRQCQWARGAARVAS